MCAKYALDVEDSPAFQSNACMKAEMYIEMHYVWAGANVEPTPMLDFFIARLTPKEYADLLKGDEIYLNRVFGNKLKAFQSVVVIYSIAESHSWRHFLVFRKDVQLKDGDVVVAGARLVDNKGVVPNKEEDVKSITEILNSITSLEN
jgi:hypothetical protein